MSAAVATEAIPHRGRSRGAPSGLQGLGRSLMLPGAVDDVLNYEIATRARLLIPIGLGYALIYYVVFRWAIIRWNLRTPGRGAGPRR